MSENIIIKNLLGIEAWQIGEEAKRRYNHEMASMAEATWGEKAFIEGANYILNRLNGQ